MKNMTKKQKSLIVVISSVLVIGITISGTLLFETTNTDTENSVKTLVYSNQDNSYVEPTPTNGKYYLSGNKDNIFFTINNDTIKLCGNEEDIYSFSEIVYKGYLENRDELCQKSIEFWSKEQNYCVTTIHGWIREDIAPNYEVKFIHVPADRTDEFDIMKSFGCDIMFIDNETLSFGDSTFILDYSESENHND